MYPVIGIGVAIDQAAERGEWQIEAIDGVGEEYRVPFRGFDSPQVVEFYKETFGVEKWRTTYLTRIAEADWRARKIKRSTWRPPPSKHGCSEISPFTTKTPAVACRGSLRLLKSSEIRSYAEHGQGIAPYPGPSAGR